jgi:hypothetical protein
MDHTSRRSLPRWRISANVPHSEKRAMRWQTMGTGVIAASLAASGECHLPVGNLAGRRVTMCPSVSSHYSDDIMRSV